MGDLDSALATYRRAQLRSPDRPIGGLAITLAVIHVALGDLDAAFAAFDRAVAAHDAVLMAIDAWPELDPVRSDPRYAALRRRVFGTFDTGAGTAK